MATSLSTLPVEVIEVIANALDSTDLSSLRLTCKELNRRTLCYFAQTFFATVRTDLSPKSLQKLHDISENEQFKHRAQNLLIRKWDDELGQGFQWHRHASCHVEAPLSPGVRTLQELLVNKLVNCRSFHIHSRGGVEEYYESTYLLSSDAVGIILGIIAETALPVKSFIVNFRKQASGFVDSYRLQTPLYQQSSFKNAWAQTQELSLECCLMADTVIWASDLVLPSTNLKKLSLHFDFEFSVTFLKRLLPSPNTF